MRMPPPPTPRRSSMLPLSCRPSHLIADTLRPRGARAIKYRSRGRSRTVEARLSRRSLASIMQAMDLGLSGKIAVVTGSSRGLGLASARALAAEGCHVVLCARSRAGLDSAIHVIAETAAPPSRLHAVEADVSTN